MTVLNKLLVFLLFLYAFDVSSQDNSLFYRNVVSYFSSNNILGELSYLKNKRYIKRKFIKNDTLLFSISNDILKTKEFICFKKTSLNEIKDNFGGRLIKDNCCIKDSFFELSTDKQSNLMLFFSKIYDERFIIGEFAIIKDRDKYTSFENSNFFEFKHLHFFIEFNKDGSIKNIVFSKKQYVNGSKYMLNDNNKSPSIFRKIIWLLTG